MALELPNAMERSSSSSIRELSEEAQKKIDLYKSARDSCPPLQTMAAILEPATFASRTLREPIAAVEICPNHPEYMIVGTYALLKPDQDGVSEGQVRTGSICVVPLAVTFQPAYPGATPPSVDEQRLNAAVLDIHFHPSDDSLLGVASSDAKLTFFRLTKFGDVLARRIRMQLDYLGSIKVTGPNEHGEVPLITSFCWLPGLIREERGVTMYYHLSFAATVSDGDVKMLSAIVPVNPLGDREADEHYNAVLLESVNLERHSEEAWIVAATPIPTTTSSSQDINQFLLLSGGDDSALIATLGTLNIALTTVGPESRLNVTVPAFGGRSVSRPFEDRSSKLNPLEYGNLLTIPPSNLWTDRKSHTAGVVAILPLSAQPTYSTIPILTGSYDEYIRLFLLDITSPVLRRSLILQKKLGGGVWRLKLMHESSHTSSDNRYSALILASCMHGGVRVLRLTYNPTSGPQTPSQGWRMDILAKFTKGHQSMNYGSDFRVERDEDGKRTGEYTMVSTSFYDKAVCVWKFVNDDEKASQR